MDPFILSSQWIGLILCRIILRCIAPQCMSYRLYSITYILKINHVQQEKEIFKNRNLAGGETPPSFGVVVINGYNPVHWNPIQGGCIPR